MADNSDATSAVGYGRPPAEHRFAKGKSGNPNGRPKKSKNTVPVGQGLDFGTQPANRMLLEEAYRNITIREGEKVLELPVIKAVFRALVASKASTESVAAVRADFDTNDRKWVDSVLQVSAHALRKLSLAYAEDAAKRATFVLHPGPSVDWMNFASH